MYKLIILIMSMCICMASSCEKDECPYETEYNGHFLTIPLTIEPLQYTYQVGDTVRISTIFSDSIYDSNVEKTFKIEGFPFKPLTLLFRFEENLQWGPGYYRNQVTIDEKYEPYYSTVSSRNADGYRCHTYYNWEKEQYEFEMQVVFTTPGRYLMLMGDLYLDHAGTGHPELNAEADAITWEGKCNMPLALNYTVQGDTHLDSFIPELNHLDTTVYRDNLSSLNVLDVNKPLGRGGLLIEWSGFFGFEVVE